MLNRLVRSPLPLLAIAFSAMTCCGVQSTTAQDRKRSGSRIYETVDLKTRDGLKLKAYYFESEKEKKAVPVLLVHAWEGQSSQYFPLYKALHAAGHAVLVVDYRGHGKSDRTIRLPNGREKELTPKQMGRRDVEAIVQMDLEAAKGFLKEKNNDGKLNLNALVVAGVGEGCVMAVQWAVIDWKFPSVGRVKQGQDVKGLVLISPKKLVKGISIEPIYNNRALVALPIMVIGSEQSRDASDTRQIIKRIQGMKRRFGRGNIERFDEIMAPTTLVGASLINGYDKVVPAVVDFVDREIKVDDEVNRWVARE